MSTPGLISCHQPISTKGQILIVTCYQIPGYSPKTKQSYSEHISIRMYIAEKVTGVCKQLTRSFCRSRSSGLRYEPSIRRRCRHWRCCNLQTTKASSPLTELPSLFWCLGSGHCKDYTLVHTASWSIIWVLRAKKQTAHPITSTASFRYGSSSMAAAMDQSPSAAMMPIFV